MRWLAIFLEHIDCSPDFASFVNDQLTAQAAQLAHIKLDSGGFVLMPEQDSFQFLTDERNITSVSGYLVGPDADGFAVTFAWWCEGFARPVDPQHPPTDCPLRVVWTEFPANELRARYAQPLEPPAVFQTTVPFETEWWAFSWPNVWLEVCFASPVSDQTCRALDSQLAAFFATWNGQRPARGRIHSILPTRRAGAHSVEVFIDFGSAAQEAVAELLQALAHPVEPLQSIRKIVGRGYSVVP